MAWLQQKALALGRVDDHETPQQRLRQNVEVLDTQPSVLAPLQRNVAVLVKENPPTSTINKTSAFLFWPSTVVQQVQDGGTEP